ncbi:dimethyladenosine transferase, partial [Marasmius crinis-equi]
RELALHLVVKPSTELWSRLFANVQLYSNANKDSFRPPPKVESSVVRIAPRDPPLPVTFEEFDRLERVIFNRRNKTLYGNFLAKGVREEFNRSN